MQGARIPGAGDAHRRPSYSGGYHALANGSAAAKTRRRPRPANSGPQEACKVDANYHAINSGSSDTASPISPVLRAPCVRSR